jgi:glucose/arabinose dehydrogenase
VRRPDRLRRRAQSTLFVGAALILLMTGSAVPASAGESGGGLVRLQKIASVAQATAMAVRADDPARYIALQEGTVVAVRGNGNGNGEEPETVLDITGFVRAGGERGLLGLTFSPNGGKLYVHYSGAAAGETVVEEYEFTNGRPDPATRRVLLTVPQPQPNHNGGELTFGPDGLLYLGLGDGGGRDDRGAGHAAIGNGQSLETLLGKILRIDPRPSGGMAYTVPASNPFVGRAGARPEIYAYGLRNPWRFSFDTKTEDLWVADVGQNEWEEVTRIPSGDAAGANFGWNLYEASHRFRDGPETDVVMPVVETSHAVGNCSITGGYVYRGTRIPKLRGWYLYTDYCNGDIKAVKVTASGEVRERDLGVSLPSVSSFGQDAAGELYVLSQNDGVYRILPG